MPPNLSVAEKALVLEIKSAKKTIYYHRAYKKFKGTPTASRWTFFALWIFFDLAVLIGHAPILDSFILASGKLLQWLNCPFEVNLWQSRMVIIDYIPHLTMPIRFPGPGLALINFIVCVGIVIFLPRIKKMPRPIMVWSGFVAVINAIAAAYFILWPYLFPYDVAQFSLLYLGTELGIWLMIPIILAAAVAPLPAPIMEKAAVILLTLIYSVVFGIVRYVVFLFLLYKASVLYMAVMFFSFGPLFDFVYIVGFYAYYGKIISLRLKNDEEAWQWLYSH